MGMENPLISIIIPVYNWENHISKCLDSILNQTYSKFEIIVINDGSTDNTLQVLKKYDGHITVITHKNQGVWLTRNVGIKHAKWDYIMFVDNDDFIKVESLKNFVNEIRKEDYDIIIGWYNAYDWKNYKKIELKWDLFSQYAHHEPRSRVFNKKFLVKNKLLFWNLRSHEDLLFSLEAYSKTDHIKFIDDSWYIYFIANQESITKTMQRHYFEDFWKSLELCCKNESKNKRNKVYSQYKIVKMTVLYLLYGWEQENYDSFMKEYKKQFKLMKSYFNIYSTIKIIHKESFKWALCVFWFLFFDMFHIVNIFAKIYYALKLYKYLY